MIEECHIDREPTFIDGSHKKTTKPLLLGAPPNYGKFHLRCHVGATISCA